jgi:type VI secretion system protein ImpA
MTSIEELLAPVSPDKPCGDDPAYDPDFLQLEVVTRGKPETVLSKEDEKAEEPNWNEVEQHCLDIFSRSKHLYLAVVLSLAWLKLQGLPGFRDGVALVRGLLERYWDPIYPRLDPEDGNDPTERVNILASLCAPAGTLGDWMRFVLRVRQAPLYQSRETQISASDIIKAETGVTEARSVAEIKNGFASAPPAEIQEKHRALAEILVHVREIDAILTREVGPASNRSWNELIDTVQDVQQRFARYAPNLAGQPGSSNAAASADGTAEAAGNDPNQLERTAAGIGAVQSGRDVLRALEMICEYYRRTEPSSPIPLLLRRAQRLVDKDFMQILNELTPSALDSLKVIVGEDSTAAESTAADAE